MMDFFFLCRKKIVVKIKEVKKGKQNFNYIMHKNVFFNYFKIYSQMISNKNFIFLVFFIINVLRAMISIDTA